MTDNDKLTEMMKVLTQIMTKDEHVILIRVTRDSDLQQCASTIKDLNTISIILRHQSDAINKDQLINNQQHTFKKNLLN